MSYLLAFLFCAVFLVYLAAVFVMNAMLWYARIICIRRNWQRPPYRPYRRP